MQGATPLSKRVSHKGGPHQNHGNLLDLDNHYAKRHSGP